MDRRRQRGILVWVAVAAMAAGCATRGRHFDVDSVNKIRVGVTTMEDCKRWFGEPIRVRQNASGGVGWGYEVEETETRSTSSITKVARAIGSIFGYPWIFPPVDVEYENSTRHKLMIIFHPDGTVADYTYERKETPSKRVY